MEVISLDWQKAKLVNLLVEKKVNQHSLCSLELLLYDWTYQDTLHETLGNSLCVQDDTTLYFCGVVKEVHSNNTFLQCTVTVTLMSFSTVFDAEEKNRVFQSEGKLWKDVFSTLSSLSSASLEIQCVGEEVPSAVFSEEENRILHQQRETDFRFLVETAEKLGISLFVEDVNQNKSKLYLGKCMTENSTSLPEKDCYFVEKRSLEGVIVLHVGTKQYIPFGSRVEFLGFSYVLTEFTLEYWEDVATYRYQLRRDLNDTKKAYQKKGVADLGKARVLSKEDPERLGRIQVAFLETEDALTEKSVWISYLPAVTEQSLGVISIPSQDEIVHVMMENNQGFVIGCERGVAIDENIDVAQHHTTQFHQGKISFTKEEVSVSFQGESLTVWKEESVACGSKNISLEAEEVTGIKSKSIGLVAEESLAAKGKTVGIESETLEMTGKEVSLTAGTTLKLEGTTVNLSGSKEVNAKTNKFNIV